MKMNVTRRQFLKAGIGTGAAFVLPWAARPGVAVAAPLNLTKFIQQVPLPGAGIVVATPSGTNRYSFVQRQIIKQLHPQLPPTPFWAYDDGSGLGDQAGSFGMAVVAQSGTPLTVNFTNQLPATYPAWIPVDTRLTPLGNEVDKLWQAMLGVMKLGAVIMPTTTAVGPGDLVDRMERGAARAGNTNANET